MCCCSHPAAILGNVRAYTLAQGALLLLSLWVPHQDSRFISATGSIKPHGKALWVLESPLSGRTHLP